MRRALLAALFVAGICVSVVRAADPANVAAVEKFLRDDEKAFLAAVLTNPTTSAEFDADVKLADGDPKVMKLVLDKWRGRLAAFAQSESNHPTPDVEGTYKNYGAMMSAPMRAYLVRLLKTMTEDNRNTLIGYLDSVNSALAENNGHLTWYTKKVVAGVFEKYRGYMTDYLATPIGKDASRNAGAAEAELAKLRKPATPTAPVVDDAAARAEKERLAREQAERQSREQQKKPVKKPGPQPVDDGATKDPLTVANPPVEGTVPLPTDPAALEQLKRAKEAAERAGGNFDGSTNRDANAGGVIAPPSGLGGTGLAPTTGGTGAKPTLVGEVPSPTDADDAFMGDISKLKTGKPKESALLKYGPAAAGGLLGGLIGFLFGGPVGLLIGLGAGILVGAVGGEYLKKKFLH